MTGPGRSAFLPPGCRPLGSGPSRWFMTADYDRKPETSVAMAQNRDGWHHASQVRVIGPRRHVLTADL